MHRHRSTRETSWQSAFQPLSNVLIEPRSPMRAIAKSKRHGPGSAPAEAFHVFVIA